MEIFDIFLLTLTILTPLLVTRFDLLLSVCIIPTKKLMYLIAKLLRHGDWLFCYR